MHPFSLFDDSDLVVEPARHFVPNRVHIPHLEIDKLACQAKSAGIFSFAETSVGALCVPFFVCYLLTIYIKNIILEVIYCKL